MEHNPELDLADVAHTLQVGRKAMAGRLGMIVGSRAAHLLLTDGFAAARSRISRR
ncbi:hypothetical protein KVH30_36610 [Streptomyces olivaceus]|nr:hypothetical protein [Streptomyces olivaceus]MBZ6296048.1 hypothetical protein [Streptomyces olivaceus]MBZ6330992.1 hypothetical protein [Streptomyces olivaceus]